MLDATSPQTEPMSLAERTRKLMEDLLEVRDGIEAALAHAYGSHTFDDVVMKIITGDCHFYKLDGCFLIMQVITYPRYKTYHCFLASGNQGALDQTWEGVKKTAAHLGCKYVTITGRRGWERRLQSRGWKHMYSTMGMEV